MLVESQPGSGFTKSGICLVDHFVDFSMRNGERRADNHRLSDGPHDKTFLKTDVPADHGSVILSGEWLACVAGPYKLKAGKRLGAANFTNYGMALIEVGKAALKVWTDVVPYPFDQVFTLDDVDIGVSNRA
jgi:hypothetical protein